MTRVIAPAGRRPGAPGVRFVACPVCDLRSPDPLPTSDDLAAHYDGYGNYAQEGTFERAMRARRGPAARLVKKIRRAVGAHPEPARLLEVGCSNGSLLGNLHELSGLECHGVEVDPQSGAVAARQLPPGRVRVGTLDEAAFPDAHFSVLVVEQVIEHVLDTTAFLRACRRVLAPEGVAFFATPNFAGISARTLGPRWKEQHPGEHVRMFTPRALRAHLQRAGFRQVRIKTGGISLIVEPGRRNVLPLGNDRLPVRLAAKLLGAFDLGDGLSATARI